jgi:hypothetical protein
MAMPPQLERGLWLKRHYRRREQRPLAENLPSINVNDLKIPRDYKTYTAPYISLRYPQISGIRLAFHSVEFHHSGRVQTFRLKWIKTGFGYPRPAFICQCGRPVISLYYRHSNLACRRCTNAIYTSQVCGEHSRPALQSHRIKQFLKFKLGLTRKTKQRLQARCTTNAPMSATKRITDKALLPPVNYQVQALPLWR